MAVVVSHSRVERQSLRLAEPTASTMVSDDISSTNELIEVNGMSYTCSGAGPPWVRPR